MRCGAFTLLRATVDHAARNIMLALPVTACLDTRLIDDAGDGLQTSGNRGG